MFSYPFTFEMSEHVISLFERERIYLAHLRRIRDVYPLGRKLTIKSPVIVERHATMPHSSFLNMGAYSYALSALDYRASIGRYCSIAKGCQILGIEHPINWISTHTFTFRKHHWRSVMEEYGAAPDAPPFQPDLGPITIGNDVWIGQNVMLRPGITIGDGAIIASGAVVVKDVLPYEIVGGVSAKHLRFRFEYPLIERMLRDKWWQYNIPDFAGLSVDKPVAFLDELEERVINGSVKPWRPKRLNLAEEIAAL